MQIGIIGSGKIGANAGTLWARGGHAVLFSSRHPERLESVAAQAGSGARVGTPEEAARFGEVVLLAIPFGEYRSLPAAALAGKIVVDAMNYFPQRDGEIDFSGLTSCELVARTVPGAHLVKAFNTIYFERLRDEGRLEAPHGERLAIPIAGDDAQAKAVVARLIEEIGFAPVDTGALREGGQRQQPDSALFNRPLTGDQAREALATP